MFKKINTDKEYQIKECDGTKLLITARDVFPYIDCGRAPWNPNITSIATEKTFVDIYCLTESRKTKECFSTLNLNISRPILTQHQIYTFSMDFDPCFRPSIDRIPTLFFFESENYTMIAMVMKNLDSEKTLYFRYVEDNFLLPLGTRIVVPV